MSKVRIAAAALSLSAMGLVAILGSEGFTDRAVIPVKNDRPTVGFGSTFRDDGTPVKMGDTTTPTRALITAATHISREEAGFRASIPSVKLYQAEYDVYMDWVYQYGVGKWQKSSMRRHLLNGDYRAACNALLLYKYSGGYDCSTPGNKICDGVWTRQIERNKKCMEAQ